MRHPDPRVDRIIVWFEALSAADLPQLGAFYADDAYFKDPFNELRGVARITAVFAHMFATLEQPRFVIREAITEGDQCFLTWDFLFAIPRWPDKTITVRGGSHLRLDASGRIQMHRDYWDVAEELYEKLPILGGLMRWLKARAKVD